MHFRAGRFRKALYCFDRALELKPGNQHSLVSRSQCHLKLGDAKAALEDAQASFDKDETYINGLYQFAEALFNLGQFEQAAIAYHRGLRARRDREEFKIGCNKCQEAIRKAIGERQATQIEDLEDILPRVDTRYANLNKDVCCVLDTPEQVQVRKNVAQEKTKPVMSKTRTRWVDREILGSLQQDKDYLTKFLKRPDIEGNQQNSSEALRNSAKEALSYLEIREDFWRQQNPMYCRVSGLNFNNDMVLQYEQQERERMEACRKIKMDAAKGAVVKHLSQIEHALRIGRAHDCQLECTRALRQIKEISVRLLPQKAEFTTEILHFKGMALMKMKSFDQAAATFQEEYGTASQNKMAEIKSRALDFLGRSYALKGSYAEAAEVFEARMIVAKTPVEKAYLFHEIGRCNYEMNKMDMAMGYAKQSLDEAVKINDNIWAMNATILLAQVAIKAREFDQAMDLFGKAEEYAIKCGNKGNVQLLREGQQCLKVYLEKESGDPNSKISTVSQTSPDVDKLSDDKS